MFSEKKLSENYCRFTPPRYLLPPEFFNPLLVQKSGDTIQG